MSITRWLLAVIGLFSILYSVIGDDWKFLVFSIICLYVYVFESEALTNMTVKHRSRDVKRNIRKNTLKHAILIVVVTLIFIICAVLPISINRNNEIEVVPIDEKLEKLTQIEMVIEALLEEEFGYIPCNKFVDYNETHICTNISQKGEFCKCKKFEKIINVAETLIGSGRFYKNDTFWLLFDKWKKLGKPCLSWKCEFRENTEYCACVIWGG